MEHRHTPLFRRLATFCGVPIIVLGLYLLLVGALMIPDDPLYRSAIIMSGIPTSTQIGADYLCDTGTRVAPVIVALLMLAFGGKRRYRLAGAVMLAAIAVALGTEVVKHLLGRVRPDAIGGSNVFAGFHPGSMYHSFPSGHASNVACLAFMIAIAWPKLRWPAAIWACAVGVGRVLLDRHFPGDVVAGWGMGLALTHIVLWRMHLVPNPWRMMRLFHRQRAVLNGLLIAAVILVAVPVGVTNHIGLLIVLVGLMGRAWTLAHYDHTIPGGGTGGPYTLVRHPQCLFTLIAVSGLAVMANAWLTGLLVMVGSLTAHFYWIRAADARQLRLFGQECRLHMNAIPALIPLPRTVWERTWTTRSDWRRAISNGAFVPVPLLIVGYVFMEAKEAFFASVVGDSPLIQYVVQLLG